MALAPSSGSRPACAATPSTSTEKRPTPLRAVLSLPDGPSEGSRTNTRSATRARRRMCRADSLLPTSSSELMKTTGVTAGSRPSSRSARRAKTICTSPPFMS